MVENTPVNLYLANKLESHPQLPSGAVGCMFVFPDEIQAQVFCGTTDTYKIPVDKREYMNRVVSNIRGNIIKLSHICLPEEDNDKKTEETKEDE